MFYIKGESQMEYTILKLAELAGISTRTLRYYDEINLLKPNYINASGYRIYTEKEVDILQQILFFREIDLELSEIKEIIHDTNFDRIKSLESHLSVLEERQHQLKQQIKTIKKTLSSASGSNEISDIEKFQGFKQHMLDENEKRYGKEARKKYGNDTIDASNAKLMKLSPQDYKKMQQLEITILKKLETAVQKGEDPKGNEGQIIAKMHKDWLSFSWLIYIKEAHSGLVQMYTEDEKYIKYYDRHVKGCAEFLKEAVLNWLSL